MPNKINKKNILIFTTWFPNKNEKARCIFVENIIESQSKNYQLDLKVVVPRPYIPDFSFIPNKFKRHNSLDAFKKKNNYAVYRPFYFKMPFFGEYFFWKIYFYSIVFWFKKHNLDPIDLIHSHGIFPDSYIAIKLGQKYNIPVICHFHDSYFKKINKNYEKYVSEIVKSAKVIIAVSEFQKNIVLEEYPDTKNIVVVNNGVDSDKFVSNNSKNKKNKFIFIGNLIYTKGLDILIEAIKDIDNIEIDVYGQGENEKLYKKMADDLNVKNKIFFKGVVENEKLPTIFPNYSGLILPSRHETFGIVLIEAMSCGLFVIATNICAIPEIVVNKKYGLLFEMDNVEELKNCILKSNKTSWNRKEISNYGRSYDIHGKTRQINELYFKSISS